MTYLWRCWAAGRYPPGRKVCLGMTGDLWGLLVMVGERVVAILRPQRVNVHRTVGGLRCNVFVQRIPGYALDVMLVFGNLADKRS
jgi:hypothetical protein